MRREARSVRAAGLDASRLGLSVAALAPRKSDRRLRAVDMGNVVVCRSPLVDPLPSSQSPATSTPSGTSDSSGNTRAGPAVRARAASLGDGGHGAPACEREGGQGPFDLAAPDSDDRKLQQRAARCDEMVRALVRALRVARACMSRLGVRAGTAGHASSMRSRLRACTRASTCAQGLMRRDRASATAGRDTSGGRRCLASGTCRIMWGGVKRCPRRCAYAKASKPPCQVTSKT